MPRKRHKSTRFGEAFASRSQLGASRLLLPPELLERRTMLSGNTYRRPFSRTSREPAAYATSSSSEMCAATALATPAQTGWPLDVGGRRSAALASSGQKCVESAGARARKTARSGVSPWQNAARSEKTLREFQGPLNQGASSSS